MLNEQFGTDVRRYADFTEDMVDAVLGRGGTLKAEHGTGRVMAPFVRRQYGDEPHAVMWEIKRLCEPGNTLNPGVVLTDDPHTHLRNLKTVVTVEPEVDRCVECGYCEPVCPSRDPTTTPRQRILLRRELAAARSTGDDVLARKLEEEYRYDAVDTCAVDGMCATACPVLINTGDLIKRLRAERHGPIARAGWKAAANHWRAVTRTLDTALDVAAASPSRLTEAAGRAARAIGAPGTVPQWSHDLPRGGEPRRAESRPEAHAVYLPSCMNTLFAPADGGPGVMASVRRLAERAGLQLHIPEDIANLCCGTPWSSKGFTDGHDVMHRRVSEALVAATDGGRVPVISDASSCTEGFERLTAATASSQRQSP